MLNINSHKKILLQILFDICSDKTIAPFLGFKGETAAYLFYNLPRFSVDLDFDLLDISKENEIFNKIQKIIKQYGVIKEAQIKRFNLLFILSYDQKIPSTQNVKIEINRRNFGSKYELKSYMGISMLVMTKKDMFSHKLMAMHERLGKTNRDIYDVWFFEKNNWLINKELVEAKSKMPYKKFLQKLIFHLEKLNNRNILSGLGELLDEKQKSWVKTKLKLETLFLLKIRLSNCAD
ncbi:MAG: nucleotidyl transferase AbiEii/AbiGii toxin family protein [Patescibacteria group bacterium]